MTKSPYSYVQIVPYQSVYTVYNSPGIAWFDARKYPLGIVSRKSITGSWCCRLNDGTIGCGYTRQDAVVRAHEIKERTRK